MCVAVLIESDKGPSEGDIRAMYEDNPHGAGVAWALGDLVRYRKGLSLKQVIDLLPTIPRPALLHFRWATHGGVDRVMTHPFPIGRRALTSRKLNGAARAVLIHNGTWNDYQYFAPEGVDTSYWSDTAVAAYAAGEYGEEILDHVKWATAVGRAGGNGRLDVTLRGTWTEYEGNMYSNLLWKPAPKLKVELRPNGGLSFVKEGDAWTEYFNRKYSTQPSHSAYDDDPIGLQGTEDVDYPHWNAQGQLVSRGRGVEVDTIGSWVDEFQAANEACGVIVRKKGRK